MKSYNSKSTAPVFRLLLMLLIIVIAVAILDLMNVTHLFHKQAVPKIIPVQHTSSSVDKSSNSASSSSNTSNQTNQTEKVPSPAGSALSSSGNLTLLSPYGDFVSNHRPGQNGSSLDEVSVCNTTPGAQCYIQFSKGQTVTQLPSQTVNSSGSSSWSWNISSDAHLTSGSWQITAVSTLNGQTKATNDPTKLEIQ